MDRIAARHSLLGMAADAAGPFGIDGRLSIELRGDLAGILAISEAGKDKTFSAKEKALQIKMVAGACNHRELTLPPIPI